MRLLRREAVRWQSAYGILLAAELQTCIMIPARIGRFCRLATLPEGRAACHQAPPISTGFKFLLREPPKRPLQKQPSTSTCRLLATPPIPGRPEQGRIVTRQCRLESLPSPAAEATLKETNRPRRVLVSNFFLISHRSDFKGKNHHPTGVDFKSLPHQPPK